MAIVGTHVNAQLISFYSHIYIYIYTKGDSEKKEKKKERKRILTFIYRNFI